MKNKTETNECKRQVEELVDFFHRRFPGYPYIGGDLMAPMPPMVIRNPAGLEPCDRLVQQK